MPQDPLIGKACAGPQDCDERTYCYSEDRDCGPGKCKARPETPHGREIELYCGCDGKMYGTENAAPYQGIDLGKNGRCDPTPGVNWRCGDRIICGLKPCKPIYEICNPNNACTGHNSFGDELCIHSIQYGYYCDILGFDIKSCDDKRLLAVCNGCFDSVPCGSDNTHEFTSVSCTEDACQLRTVECIK